MSENTTGINDFLSSIGLMDNGTPLATIRSGVALSKSYDLDLLIDIMQAVSLVEEKLNIPAQYQQADGSEYWNFHIHNEWSFYFESYRSGSKYMVANDLRRPILEKPVTTIPSVKIISLTDITNQHKKLKENFQQAENQLTIDFKNNFESQMRDMLAKVSSIKAVVWVQYTSYEFGIEHDFIVFYPHFLSFIPEELKGDYDSEDLPTQEDFIIISQDVEKTSYLNHEEIQVCITMRDIIVNNEVLFKNICEDNQAFCLTENELKKESYDPF